MARIKQSWNVLLIYALLTVATLATFWPVCHHDFINYDDNQYVTENPHVLGGVSWENVKWAATSGYASNWHPLTWLSHMTDEQLFGANAGWHHLGGLLFHTANALLLFSLLRCLTGALWRSAFVAALFALHPLHVESVAWVAERKDVLSGFFFMLTLLAYARYAQKGAEFKATDGTDFKDGAKKTSSSVESVPSVAKSSILHPAVSPWYWLAQLLFALGLMSKPMLVTLPFVLLLLDFWPLQRFELKPKSSNLKTLLLEKLPFFALSAASCLVTLLVQRHAMVEVNTVSLLDRLANAGLAYLAYLQQTFWPVNLAIFYPLPSDIPVGLAIAAWAVLGTVTVLALLLIRRRPSILVGWLWYLGMLVPVIGLVQVGSQARADRYTYLPLLGIFLLLAWGMPTNAAPTGATLAGRKPAGWWNGLPSGLLKGLLAGAGVLALIGLALTAHRQVLCWQNSHTVFAHATQATKENYIAYTGLGIADLARGDGKSAQANLARALEFAGPHKAGGIIKYYMGVVLQMQGKGLEALPYLEKCEPPPHLRPERDHRLGLSLMEVGRLSESETYLRQAVEAQPDNPKFQVGLAVLLYHQRQTAKAEDLFRELVSKYPDMVQPHRSFADFLLETGRVPEAEGQYAAAVKLSPSDTRLRQTYAMTLGRLGKTNEAVQQLEAVSKLGSNDSQTSLELAQLFSQLGRSREAAAHYNQALAAEPNLISALNNLAWLLATDPDDQVRNGPQAVELAERACQQTEWKAPFLMGTLAAAYAEAGRFPDAIAMAERARDQARAGKLEAVAKKNEELRELYLAGKPFREHGSR